jgi:hypothetical protein
VQAPEASLEEEAETQLAAAEAAEADRKRQARLDAHPKTKKRAAADAKEAVAEASKQGVPAKKRRTVKTGTVREEDEGLPYLVAAGANYLREWKNSRATWKFKKLRQTWLLQNMYDPSRVPKPTFASLLEYLKDLKGISKKKTWDAARDILAKSAASAGDAEAEGVDAPARAPCRRPATRATRRAGTGTPPRARRGSDRESCSSSG